jgi:hypothetical protein
MRKAQNVFLILGKNSCMTTIELKRRVIDKVNKVNDESLLLDLMRLLDDSDDKEIHRLSNGHKIAVQTAINQIDNGDFLSNDQADKEIDEWLKKSV